jgi:hypothetical protein
MSKYVTKCATFYAVEPEITEIESIYMTWKVGECLDGTVYLCLDREDETAYSVTNCDACYATLEDFFAAYPDLEGQEDTGMVDEEGNPVLKDIISRMTVS